MIAQIGDKTKKLRKIRKTNDISNQGLNRETH